MSLLNYDKNKFKKNIDDQSKKYSFTGLKVKFEIECLRQLIGTRVGNIHQITKDHLLIRFWKMGFTRNVFFENGKRFDITDFPREKPKIPSDFCCRLRKELRFRRLDDIQQPTGDKAVLFYKDIIVFVSNFFWEEM
jgi:predicted ribosome quality control (RQC) complex YloA/Tae2 family protein